MSLITWNADFVLGIDQFDAHHQHLISLINDTTLSLEKNPPYEELVIVLNSLIDYAWYHFNAEEQWMKEHSYPLVSEHETIHRQFSEKIADLQDRLKDNSRAVAEELSTYLNFWLIDHIVICDSLYASFAGKQKKAVLMT